MNALSSLLTPKLCALSIFFIVFATFWVYRLAQFHTVGMASIILHYPLFSSIFKCYGQFRPVQGNNVEYDNHGL